MPKNRLLLISLASSQRFRCSGLKIRRSNEDCRSRTSESDGSREFFFNEGDQAEEFFVLTSGRVKLTQLTAEGHQLVPSLIGPDEAVGGVSE